VGVCLKEFELTIPKQYIDFINKEIKKPKRPNTELLELWLEHELDIENVGTYGNLPTDESQVSISDVCFSMIVSHVQPEPHSHKMSNDNLFHCWLDIKTDKVQADEHIKVKEIA
jgi:hypothetical protein